LNLRPSGYEFESQVYLVVRRNALLIDISVGYPS
jgi:hypothetical protein